MGPGAASISPSTRAAAAELFSQGIPTVITARPLTGAGVPSPNPSSVYVQSCHFAVLANLIADSTLVTWAQNKRASCYS